MWGGLYGLSNIRIKGRWTKEYIEIEAFNLSPFRKPIGRAKKSKESTPAQKIGRAHV